MLATAVETTVEKTRAMRIHGKQCQYRFFTRQGLHLNNLVKKKIAFQIASVVTEIFRKQEEIISLNRKNEYEVSVSDSSNEDNIILQEDPKATPSTTVSVEALTDDVAQD